jgi:hypothetical protein
MNILFCSLIRSKEPYLKKWHDNVKGIKALQPYWNFNVSLYENDSEDNSVELINSFDWKWCDWFKLTSEKRGRKYMMSTERKRIERLSSYRNMCIWQFGDLDSIDRIIMNDVDCDFNPRDAAEIIEESLKWDVYSFASRDSGTGDELYDRWATRREPSDKWWDDKPYDQNGNNLVWTTGNGFVCYNPEPFRRGITFGYANNRFPYIDEDNSLKHHDVENAVVCENFRSIGFNKIGFNGKYNTVHSRDKKWHEEHNRVFKEPFNPKKALKEIGEGR